MKRNIIEIDEEKCDGCGLCVAGCHEGALQIVNGKAKLVSDNICDGLGACLGDCPRGALKIVEREAAPFEAPPAPALPTELRQWPTQLALLRTDAPFFRNADLLIVADCVPFACGDFHARLLKGKIIVQFCPKLDARAEEYVEKLAEILRRNSIRSITIARMEVPCCGGTVRIVEEAIQRAGVDMRPRIEIIPIP